MPDNRPNERPENYNPSHLDTGYPVLREKSLDPPSRRWFSRGRDLSELPRREPGTVLVFATSLGYQAFPENRHVTGAEDIVVNATSVSVVAMRPRLVPVTFTMPSLSAADDFTVQVQFYCKVEQPELVAANGLFDVPRALRSQLGWDTRLRTLAAARPVEQLAILRDELSAHIRAHCQLSPPAIAGMTVRLDGSTVYTPQGLAEHERSLRDVDRGRARQRREHEVEDDNIARTLGYIQAGPDAVASVDATRQGIDLATAIERAHRRGDQALERQLEVLRALPQEMFETSAFDVDGMISSLVRGQPARLTDEPSPELPRAGEPGDEPPVVEGESDEQPG